MFSKHCPGEENFQKQEHILETANRSINNNSKQNSHMDSTWNPYGNPPISYCMISTWMPYGFAIGVITQIAGKVLKCYFSIKSPPYI